MFSVEERDLIQRRLLHLAEQDPGVVAAAITGSHATNDEDRWSDIDLAFGVSDPLDAVMGRWTQQMYQDFAAVHHWDLTSGSAIYRVFLLPHCLEVDLSFSPEVEFGPRGPSWRLIFGRATPPRASAPSGHDGTAGLAWHHALHARISIERGRYWQAEHWISAMRAQTIALACQRLGHPTSYAKGAHLLPPDITGPLETTLVRSTDETELRRALAAAATALTAELTRTDPTLADRLHPILSELTAIDRQPRSSRPQTELPQEH
ncbi:nucleotidyltransferase domain-containing protein [Micromonospora sp. MED01]|uniref:nucleotidyltransferase domain-containing protein n=1 Tax=Micromonospora alfalfae TaxID=2911212 RepID=UPI001EE82CC1|nr:nucleotidyltransferase domain-containing protein [Micromonospora alfalfae]MCG5463818.1 nucleotidyltransferase domain-containing protein [Micromonospora alfalfae]